MPNKRTPEEFAHHFWEHVNKPAVGCWEWQKSAIPTGYGQVHFRKKIHLTHRVAFELFYGNDPSEKMVCHKCDNPPCCRPDHLFLGTAKDNVRDAIKKGRAKYCSGEQSPWWGRRGEDTPHAKLTNDKIPEIRKLRQQGLTLTEIGKRFGVSRVTIKNVTSGQSWSHIQ